MKTLAGWREGPFHDLHSYLAIGDFVDDAMYEYFRDILPPLVHTGAMLQVSEPCDHVDGRPTFITFVRKGHVWAYAGECWARDSVHRPRPSRG